MSNTSSSGPADTAIGNALCAKLQELAAVTPPTPRSLMALEQTARMAREILVAIIDPYAFRSKGGFQTGVAFGALGYDNELPFQMGTNSVASGVSMPALAPSSYGENFGAEVLRQLGAAKAEGIEKQDSMLELVAAIKLCRDGGMHELADKLEQKLLGSKVPQAPILPSTDPIRIDPIEGTEAAQ